MDIGKIFMELRTKGEPLDSSYLKILTQVVTSSHFVVCKK